jgi:hypothetical protein
MKKLLTLISASVLAASAAVADISASVGISGNYAAYAGTGEEKNYSETGTLKTTTKEYGAFTDEYASVFAEINLGDIVSLGVDYVPMDIESPQNISNDGSNQNRVQVDFKDLTTIYAKINVPQLGGTYLKVGYSTVDISINESMNSGTTYADRDTSGINYGIGYAHEVAAGFSLRAELTYSEFDSVETNNGVATTGNYNNIKVTDMIGGRGTISLVKSF